MARINLLPWREEYRQEKKKEFVTQLIGVCILAALISWVWIHSVNSAIENQQGRNNLLAGEIKLLDTQVKEIKELKTKRQELLSRMKVIQDLQGTRPVIVRYFDEFSRAVPDGVFITSLSRNNNNLNIVGISESNNRVSDFMRRLNASEFFDAPNLKSVNVDPKYGDQSSRFNMQVKLVLPEADQESIANKKAGK